MAERGKAVQKAREKSRKGAPGDPPCTTRPEACGKEEEEGKAKRPSPSPPPFQRTLGGKSKMKRERERARRRERGRQRTSCHALAFFLFHAVEQGSYFYIINMLRFDIKQKQVTYSILALIWDRAASRPPKVAPVKTESMTNASICLP